MKEKLRQTAINLLARRDHSQLELIQKLQNKGYANNDVVEVVNQLMSEGLINELRFVENYIYWRQKKGFGPVRIKCELKARGVSDDFIAQQLEITDNAWLTEARRVWQKQFKNIKATDVKSRAKQIRFLQYRGFTQEHINNLLKETHGNDEANE